MTTLTETAYYTREGLKYTFFAIIALLILKLVLGGVNSFWQVARPKPPPKPNVAFGKLPKIKFPESKPLSEPITYTQDFVGGALPESSPSAKVYFISKPTPNLLSAERANDFARLLGFKSEPITLNSEKTLYQWTDPEIPVRTLQKDIINGNFLLQYDFYKDPSVLKEKDLAYGKQIIAEAKNLLDRFSLGTPDLREGTANVSFWKVANGSSSLISVSSVSEADMVRVDLFRAPLNQLVLVTPTYTQGPVYFLFSGSSGQKRVLLWRYTPKSIEQEIFATYPIKTTEDAWKDLTEGKGFIADWGAVKGSHVTIRKVSLAYFDSDISEPYLQPIFVFEGDEDFKVYVPAVKTEWTE